MKITLSEAASNVHIVHVGEGLGLLFSYKTCVAFHQHGVGWTVSENIWTATTAHHLSTYTPTPASERLPYEEFERALKEAMATQCT